MSVFVLFLFPVSPTRSSAFLLGDRQAGIGELMERRTTTCNYGRQAGREGGRHAGERGKEKGERREGKEARRRDYSSAQLLCPFLSFFLHFPHIPHSTAHWYFFPT